jgi:hypothetical protein
MFTASKKLISLLAFLFVMITTLVAEAEARETLRIAFNPGVAPLKFEDQNARPAGLFPDIWRKWSQVVGLGLIQSGDLDVMLNIARSPREI